MEQKTAWPCTPPLVWSFDAEVAVEVEVVGAPRKYSRHVSQRPERKQTRQELDDGERFISDEPLEGLS